MNAFWNVFGTCDQGGIVAALRRYRRRRRRRRVVYGRGSVVDAFITVFWLFTARCFLPVARLIVVNVVSNVLITMYQRLLLMFWFNHL